MRVRIQRLFVGVAVGWFFVSLSVAGWFVLSQRVADVETGQQPVTQTAAILPVRPGLRANGDPELEALLYRYFPQPLSQGLEETLIRSYFQDRRGGFLLDVGASHYRERSTTHYLDVALGWHGIAVDALVEFAEDYARFRPRTLFVAAFVSDRSDDKVDFFVNTSNTRLSTSDADLARSFGAARAVRHLGTVSLDDLLKAHRVEKIDLLSMDIELSEPKALAGFSISRYRPELVVVEYHPPIRARLDDYFLRHRYAQIEKYTRWDGRNAYFVPAEDLPAFLNRPQPE